MDVDAGCRVCGKTCACGEVHYLNLHWNGRRQFIGVVQNAKGELFMLEDEDDLESRRIPITEEKQAELAWAATLANRERLPFDGDGEFPDLTDLHWDCSAPRHAGHFRLAEVERGGVRTERSDIGVLDATVRVGDRVKVALNLAAMVSLAHKMVNQEIPPEGWATLDAMQANRSAERYWAHVLEIVGEGDAQRLTILTPDELKYMPSMLASEPFVVARKCVYGLHAAGRTVV